MNKCGIKVGQGVSANASDRHNILSSVGNKLQTGHFAFLPVPSTQPHTSPTDPGMSVKTVKGF